MTTLSTSALNWLAKEWENAYKTAVLSGIVGDLAHKKRGGYHISREDQPKTNYSVVRADDKAGNGPSDRASAIDMTMGTADIVKCHTRIRELWKNRAKDPRFKYINAWNGWDGKGDAGRYDVVTGNTGTATADHKWHIHLEIRRKYVNDMNAMRAILSILKGEPASKPTTPVVTPKPPPVEDDEMTQDEFTRFLLNAINDPKVAAQLRARPWQYVGGGIQEGKSALGVFSEIHQLVKALAATVAAESTNSTELQAALDNLPTADETADAVVDALGGQSPDQLADVLTSILGPEKAAALKAAL